jgi:hypothetical protein
MVVMEVDGCNEKTFFAMESPSLPWAVTDWVGKSLVVMLVTGCCWKSLVAKYNIYSYEKSMGAPRMGQILTQGL